MCLATSASDVATLALLDCETCHSYWDYVLFPRPPVQIGFLLQGFQTCPISLVNAPFLFRVFPTFPSNGFLCPSYHFYPCNLYGYTLSGSTSLKDFCLLLLTNLQLLNSGPPSLRKVEITGLSVEATQ